MFFVIPGIGLFGALLVKMQTIITLFLEKWEVSPLKWPWCLNNSFKGIIFEKSKIFKDKSDRSLLVYNYNWNVWCILACSGSIDLCNVRFHFFRICLLFLRWIDFKIWVIVTCVMVYESLNMNQFKVTFTTVGFGDLTIAEYSFKHVISIFTFIGLVKLTNLLNC